MQMATTNVGMAVAVGNGFTLLSDLDATTQRLEWPSQVAVKACWA